LKSYPGTRRKEEMALTRKGKKGKEEGVGGRASTCSNNWEGGGGGGKGSLRYDKKWETGKLMSVSGKKEKKRGENMRDRPEKRAQESTEITSPLLSREGKKEPTEGKKGRRKKELFGQRRKKGGEKCSSVSA